MTTPTARWLRLAFFGWLLGLLLWVLGVQRPLPLGFFLALLGHAKALAGAVSLLLGGWSLGRALERFWPLPDAPLWVRGLYRTGTGLAGWSLGGLALSMARMARPPLVAGLWGLAALLAWGYTWRHREEWCAEVRALFAALPGWWVAVAGITLLLALLPPTAFDALMYHLALPERILRTGGLQPWPVAHFWNPGHTEFLALAPLALGADRAARILHAWYALTAALWIFHRMREAMGRGAARWGLMVFLSMPSLALLASWAYNDFALSFYTVAALEGLSRYLATRDRKWLPWAGMAAGLAAGTKYTGLLVPGLVVGFPWLVEKRRGGRAALATLATALLFGGGWYARNALYMGNPLYPFFFGGRGWDGFLQRWIARAGSGLGSDLWSWLALPLTTVAGMGAHSYMDARIGPWWLILAPWIAFWVWRWLRKRPPRRRWLLPWGLFVVTGLAVWLYGVAWSELLRQPRLLYPVLAGLTPFAGYAVHGLRLWHRPGDLPWRRLVRFLLVLSVALTLLEHTLYWVKSRGPAFALGQISAEDWYRHNMSLYLEYLELLEHAPEDARVYVLFEPRSYRAPREVLPDTLLVHWPHALHLYGTPERALQGWRNRGYTHLVVGWHAAGFLYETSSTYYRSPQWRALRRLNDLAPLVARSPSGAYTLHRIPSALSAKAK